MSHYNPEKALMEVKREFGEHGGVAPSIERSSTFTVIDPETMPEIFTGIKGPHQGGCFLYSRHFNPTLDVLARNLAAMEGTEHAVTTASGISAIACTIMQLCQQGDHVVASNTIYGGSHALLKEMLPEMGITTTFVDPSKSEQFEAAIQDNTKVIYTETLGNPTLKLADIPRLSTIAKKHNCTLVVDNTFTPLIFSPIALGADIVVYSMTKFINGASDNIAGAVCASKEFILQLMDLHRGRVMLLGPTMDPRSAFDILQRLPHLPLRMREHSTRTMAIAKHLHECNAPIVYPGLPSYTQHDLFKSMYNEEYGFGGMLTIDCKTTEKANEAMKYLQNEVNFGLIAVSLGYFDTLMSCSGSSTSSEISKEEQAEMELSPGLLRMAIGYTGTIEDRIKQIETALKHIDIIS